MVAGAQEAIQEQTILEAQCTNCPIDVQNEVCRLWEDLEFGNDHYYAIWDTEEYEEAYPIIAEYLKSKGIKTCLIHWWW